MSDNSPALVAFHGQQAIKDSYLDRIEAHRAAGDLVHCDSPRRGAGSNQPAASEWRGNAIYCLVHESRDPYGTAERQLGIPRVLARLLFQYAYQTSPEWQITWPGRFLQAIPVGADLGGVWPRLAVWLLTAEPGVLRFAQTSQQRELIQTVAALYGKVLMGEEVPRKTWLAAEKAARNVDARAYADASLALFAARDADPAFLVATNYDGVCAAATAMLGPNLNLAHDYGSALAASNAVSTAYMLANHAATPGDTVCGAAAAAVSAVAYAAALAETPVAVAAAAHRLAIASRFRSRKDAYPQFVADASRVYFDDQAEVLLALLAAAPVPGAA